MQPTTGKPFLFYTPCYLELCFQLASGNYKIHNKINNSSLPPAAHKKQMQFWSHLVSFLPSQSYLILSRGYLNNELCIWLRSRTDINQIILLNYCILLRSSCTVKHRRFRRSTFVRKIQLWLHSVGAFPLSSIQREIHACVHREDSPLPCHELTSLALHLGDTSGFCYLPKSFLFSLQWRDNTHPYLRPFCQDFPLEILIWNVVDPLSWNMM